MVGCSVSSGGRVDTGRYIGLASGRGIVAIGHGLVSSPLATGSGDEPVSAPGVILGTSAIGVDCPVDSDELQPDNSTTQAINSMAMWRIEESF